MTLARTGIEEETAIAAGELLARVWTPATRRAWTREGGVPGAWKDAARAGWFDTLVEEEAGGLGLGVVEACAIAEAAGRHLLPGPIRDTLAWSPAVRAQAGTATGMLAECSAHSPEASTAAVRNGLVSATGLRADWADSADLLIVDAGSAVVAIDAHDPRVRASRLESLDLLRAPHAIDVDDAPVLGTLASGGDVARLWGRMRPLTLVLAASELLGVAESIVAMTFEYAADRRQFDRRINSFQAVQHRLVDMRVTLESMRSLCHLAQIAVRDTTGEAEALAAAAKAHASAGSRELAESALQVHGGIGFTRDCDLSPHVARALTLQSTLGDDTALCRWLGRAALDGADDGGGR